MKVAATSVALLVLCAGTAVAAPREPASFAGPFDVFAEGDGTNAAFTASYTASGYTPVGFRVTSTLTATSTPNFLPEVTLVATAPSGEQYRLQMSPVNVPLALGESKTTTVVFPFEDISATFGIGAPTTIAGTWSFSIIDALDSSLATDPEAVMSAVTIAMDDASAPPTSGGVDMAATPSGSLSFDAVTGEGFRWYMVTLPAASRETDTFFEMLTGGTSGDSDIALYSLAGRRVVSKSFAGGGGYAALSFGRGSGLRLGTASDAELGIGQDGRLQAGTYYLGVYSGFASWFRSLWFWTNVGPVATGTLDVQWRGGTRVITAPFAAAVDMAVSGSRQETVSPGDLKWYLVDLPAASVADASYFEIFTSGTAETTELGLYSQTGRQLLLDTRDVEDDGSRAAMSFGLGSALTFGDATTDRGFGVDGDMTAGRYYLALVNGEATWLPEDWVVATQNTGNAGDVTLNWRRGTRELALPTPVEDLGLNPDVVRAVDAGPRWFGFRASGIRAASGGYLDILTTSGLGPVNDTEIALYRRDGTIVAFSDNIDFFAGNFYSRLSFGVGAGQGTATKGDGAFGDLPDGEYFLVVGGSEITPFNTFFGVDGQSDGGFNVTISSGTRPITQPSAAVDLGTDPSATSSVVDGDLRWFKFQSSGVTAFNGRSHAIVTEALPGGAGAGDTKLAIFANDSRLLAEHDDIDFFTPNLYSSLIVGRGGDPFTSAIVDACDAGTYWIAAGPVESTFSNGFGAVQTGSNIEGYALRVTTTVTPDPAAEPPTGAVNLGTLNTGVITRQADLGVGEVKWYSFSLPQSASAANGRYVDIWTDAVFGSPLQDTQIALFAGNGRFADDDNDGPGLFANFSQLTFGGKNARVAIRNGRPFDGRDGSIPAGTYYLAVGAAGIQFSEGFGADSFALVAGSVMVNIRGGAPACPADVAGPNQSIGPDGILTTDDIIVFLSWFFAVDSRADMAGPNQSTIPDGAFTADDIIVFLGRYFAGC